MNSLYTLFSIFVLSLFTTSLLFATHNKGGEIEFIQLDDYTIMVRAITYTKLSSVQADRDSINLGWGDGNFEWLERVNGPIGPSGFPQGEIIGPDTKKNVYEGIHEYAAFGNYLLSLTDPNRNGGIINVNPPSSDNVPFHVQTSFQLQALAGGAGNSSPTLLEPPIDLGFVGIPFYHTPNAFDIDGDSIAYEPVTPFMGIDEEVPNYTELSAIPSQGSTDVTLNEETGLLVRDAPILAGDYVVAYAIKSFRNGEEIDRIIRDMQIRVLPSGLNSAPEVSIDVSTTDIIPVNVGDTVVVNIEGTDQLPGNEEVDILSTCGLYDFFTNTATFSKSIAGNTGTAQFEWVVQPEHVRQQPYQLTIKVKDAYQDNGAAVKAVVRFRADIALSNANIANAAKSISIFPNPVTSKLFIDQSFLLDKPQPYRIFNSSGRLIQNGLLKDENRAIVISDLPPGIYFIQMSIGQLNYTSRFLKK